MPEQKHLDELSNLKSTWTWLQTAIDFEYQLNDQRLNGLLLFNAILFGVLGVSLPKDGTLIGVFLPLIMVVSTFGFITSAVSWRAINAGISQIEDLKIQRSLLLSKLQLHMTMELFGAAVDSPRHKAGILPSKWFPALLTVFWISAIAWLTLSHLV